MPSGFTLPFQAAEPSPAPGQDRYNPMCTTFRWLLLVQWLGLFSLLNVTAQQAIVNLPSADITPKGKHFIMHETQWRPWNPGRYWYATNFYCYGIGKNTELAVTTYNSGTPQALNGKHRCRVQNGAAPVSETASRLGNENGRWGRW
jgi:hypothetical protein